MYSVGVRVEMINLRTMNRAEKNRFMVGCKKKLLELFAQGLSRKEACAVVGIGIHNLDNWCKRDQMFGHHCIRAQANFEEAKDVSKI